MTAENDFTPDGVSLPFLPAHTLRIALVEPDIPQNTGNIARLCAVTGTGLHLIRPLGFFISDARLRRSGMDYLRDLHPVVHDDLAAFQAVLDGNFWLFSAHGRCDLWDVPFSDRDFLVFGSETAGLPASWLDNCPERTVKIPMRPEQRCLNVSTAAGVALYEALRQLRMKAQ